MTTGEKIIVFYKVLLIAVTPFLGLAMVTSFNTEVAAHVKLVWIGLFIGAAGAITQWTYIFPPSDNNEKETNNE